MVTKDQKQQMAATLAAVRDAIILFETITVEQLTEVATQIEILSPFADPAQETNRQYILLCFKKAIKYKTILDQAQKEDTNATLSEPHRHVEDVENKLS